MAYSRLPLKDPRTIAREIPGICNILFPQLTAATVTYFNRGAQSFDKIEAVPDELIQASELQHAVLFEIAYARGEQLLNGVVEADWSGCLKVAVERQKNHFDAKLPDDLTKQDIKAAEHVAKNMVAMLETLQQSFSEENLVKSPEIFGFQWISSGNGDFSMSDKLIEVKCSSRNFGSADYRQILMYWLLSYMASIEKGALEWKTGILLNPRKNRFIEVSFDDLVSATAVDKTKVDVLELFTSVVGDYASKVLSEFRL